MSESETTSDTDYPLNVKTTQPVPNPKQVPMITAVKAAPRPIIPNVPNMFRAGKGAGRGSDNAQVHLVRQRIEIVTTDGWLGIRNIVWVDSVNTPKGIV